MKNISGGSSGSICCSVVSSVTRTSGYVSCNELSLSIVELGVTLDVGGVADASIGNVDRTVDGCNWDSSDDTGVIGEGDDEYDCVDDAIVIDDCDTSDAVDKGCWMGEAEEVSDKAADCDSVGCNVVDNISNSSLRLVGNTISVNSVDVVVVSISIASCKAGVDWVNVIDSGTIVGVTVVGVVVVVVVVVVDVKVIAAGSIVSKITNLLSGNGVSNTIIVFGIGDSDCTKGGGCWKTGGAFNI